MACSFSQICAREMEHARKYPQAKLIRLGIGDTTEPIPEIITAAMAEVVYSLPERNNQFIYCLRSVSFLFIGGEVLVLYLISFNIFCFQIDGLKLSARLQFLGLDHMFLLFGDFKR